MLASSDLKDRIALVTGASRGIGRGIALALAEAGCDVVVNYHEHKDEGLATVEEIMALGRRSIAIGADVSKATAVTAMVERIIAAFGRVDILINNVGIAVTRNLDELTEEEFDHTMAVNLKSAFLCMQAVLPGMRARHWGRIVNISSGAARGSGVIGAHYNASKAGLEGLTRGYAARLAKEGITVNAVAPSLIDTEMVRGRNDELALRIPMGRFGTTQEVAQAVLMVAGNAYMTGQTIQTNGGMHFN
jgi:3-oxoacyl-[acyl-carrier protein] reductase